MPDVYDPSLLRVLRALYDSVNVPNLRAAIAAALAPALEALPVDVRTALNADDRGEARRLLRELGWGSSDATNAMTRYQAARGALVPETQPVGFPSTGPYEVLKSKGVEIREAEHGPYSIYVAYLANGLVRAGVRGPRGETSLVLPLKTWASLFSGGKARSRRSARDQATAGGSRRRGRGR